MERAELRELIRRVIARMEEMAADREAPRPACLWGDTCDATTDYAVGEEG